VDESRVYFAEDEYPEEKIKRLKEKLHTKREEGRA